MRKNRWRNEPIIEFCSIFLSRQTKRNLQRRESVSGTSWNTRKKRWAHKNIYETLILSKYTAFGYNEYFLDFLEFHLFPFQYHLPLCILKTVFTSSFYKKIIFFVHDFNRENILVQLKKMIFQFVTAFKLILFKTNFTSLSFYYQLSAEYCITHVYVIFFVQTLLKWTTISELTWYYTIIFDSESFAVYDKKINKRKNLKYTLHIYF